MFVLLEAQLDRANHAVAGVGSLVCLVRSVNELEQAKKFSLNWMKCVLFCSRIPAIFLSRLVISRDYFRACQVSRCSEEVNE